jgi:hypothetical protein
VPAPTPASSSPVHPIVAPVVVEGPPATTTPVASPPPPPAPAPAAPARLAPLSSPAPRTAPPKAAPPAAAPPAAAPHAAAPPAPAPIPVAEVPVARAMAPVDTAPMHAPPVNQTVVAPLPIVPPAEPPPPRDHGPSSAILPLKPPADTAASPAITTSDEPLVIERPIADLVRASLRRAFAKRIDPKGVLPAERAAMTLASPPIVDRNFQAFLAWRRSVLLVVACALVPLVILRAIEVFGAAGTPPGVRALLAVPVVIEAAFAGLCFWLLRAWVSWHRQRRLLAIGFLISFVAPFLVYLVPVRSLVAGDAGVAAGIAFSVQAILVLAPRAIAAMPGVIRGAMVTKLLLPATAAPGWLMVLAAPLYALFAYLALVQPYQITGSGFFVATILALAAAAVIVGRAGWDLARAQPAADAEAIVARSRNANLIALGLAGTFALLALADLVEQLRLGALTVITTIASFAIHLLLITLVTTDGVLAALDRARGRTGAAPATDADAARQLASFVAAAGSGDPSQPAS